MKPNILLTQKIKFKMNKIISIFEEFDETTEKNKSEIYIDFLNKNKKTFKETATNYSSLIEVEGQDEKYFFSEKGQNQKFFLLLNKLKNEIKNSNVIIEEVPSTSINYFNTAINSIQHHKQVFNVDIKACYISIAHREKLISTDFFNELNNSKKSIRLKLIGCLNSQPTIIEYFDGQPQTIKIRENEYKEYYKYICYCAGEVMDEIKDFLKDDFLFFWVDGVYFKTEENKNKVFEILEKHKLKYTFEKLFNFNVELNNNSFLVTYLKDYKVKRFNLPFPTLAQQKKKNKNINLKKTIKK